MSHVHGINQITERIIGAAIAVHRELGPGMLESTYKACLAAELRDRGHDVRREVGVPIVYRGRELETGYRIDLVVDERVAVEAKRVSKLEEIHEAQLLTYLKHSGYEVGLLLNFNTVVLTRGGIRRLVWGWRVPRLGGTPALDPEAGRGPEADSEAPQDKLQ